MPIRRIYNFLPDELYKEAIETSKHLLTVGGNAFTTNHWWDYGIRKDSFPVFVHNIYKESTLHKSLKEVIEDKLNSEIRDNNIMLYYWTRFSYIPWHTDAIYDGAVTIYLNSEWNEDYGGYFLYEDKKDIKAIIPQKNLAVYQYGKVRHCTTPVNFNGEIRFTIQTFLDNRKE